MIRDKAVLLEAGRAEGKLMKARPMRPPGHRVVKRLTETDFIAGSSNFTLHSTLCF